MGQNVESKRLLALDVMRGITISGMILVNYPGNYAYNYAPLKHAEWNGLTPTDLVFPFFMFIMGVSMYLSLSKSNFVFSPRLAMKILKRTVVLILLGIGIDWFSWFCYYWSTAPEQLSFFENLWTSIFGSWSLRYSGVLQRLAISYGIAAFLVLWIRHRYIPYLIGGLLVGYAVILGLGNGFAYDETNILSWVDCRILANHMYNDHNIDPEGVLSTIPSVAHVLLGFFIGRCLVNRDQKIAREQLLQSQLLTLLLCGVVLTFSGFLLNYGCPINKKIWSPTFVLVTCGLGSSLLALLIWLIDVKGYRKGFRFFESFGSNPLFMYVAASVMAILFATNFFTCQGEPICVRNACYIFFFQPVFGDYLGSLLYAISFVSLIWCIGYQLYKRKIYIRL